jgi:two-component system, sensor histidine kinase LadS
MFQLRGCFGLLCGWLLALLAALPLAAQAAPEAVLSAVLSAELSTEPITSGVDYLMESAGQPLTQEMVMSAAYASRWKRYEGRKINLLTQALPVWFRLSIENHAGPPSVLVVDSPLLLDLRADQFDAPTGRLIATDVRGSKYAFASKRHDTAHAVPLVFGDSGANHNTTTVLLRVHSQTALILPLAVWSSEAYQASRNSHNMVMGMLFGVLTIMLLYNASLLFFTRDSNYAYYAAYLLGAILYELTVTGYGPLLIWGESLWLTRYGYTLFACLTFLSATLFIHKFLDLATEGPAHVRWGTKLLIVYWIISIGVVLVQPAWVAALRMPLVGGVSGLLGIYASGVQMARGNASARYFILAWSVLMVGTIAHMLALAGIVDSNPFTDYGQHAGFAVETLLLSVALADRIKRDGLARKQAQAQAHALTLRVQRERDEKLSAQKEAIALQHRAHEALEKSVLRRTAELEQAKQTLERANAELAQLSVTDALTQVHNRRYFDEVLAREHERSARTGAPLALLLADIDHFKLINDRCGHQGGDECLRLVATTLRQTVARATDLIARYGGEEFALVLPTTGAEQALELAERVRAAVAALQFICQGRLMPLSISLPWQMN